MNPFSSIKRAIHKSKNPLRRNLKSPFCEAAELVTLSTSLLLCAKTAMIVAPLSPLPLAFAAAGTLMLLMTPLLVSSVKDRNRAHLIATRGPLRSMGQTPGTPSLTAG